MFESKARVSTPDQRVKM